MIHRRNHGASGSQPRELDRIDRLILKALQADGRKSVSELAREVHLTTSPCLDRVRKLEEEGFIRGYTAILNHDYLGATLLIFVGVRIHRADARVSQQIRDMLETYEEVVECHMVAGDFDYIIKVRVADIEAYRHFLRRCLAALPGITQTHTYVAMEEVKSAANLKL
jgi:Lrp/AsnC family transcriptional regulator, leucine-responsive regulatory protein